MLTLPRTVTFLSRLIPPDDRETIVGDLLEDAAYRDLSGPLLTIWLCAECGNIAAGLAIDRVRGSCIPPLREMAAGVALDSVKTIRHARGGPIGALFAVLLFCASAVAIALSVRVLIATLLDASYK
jgi:hypothetical protein